MLYSDLQNMLVLSSAIVSHWYTTAVLTDGSTNPENYGYYLIYQYGVSWKLVKHQLCKEAPVVLTARRISERELNLLCIDMFAILCVECQEGVHSGRPDHSRTNLINVGDVLHRFVLVSVGKKGVLGWPQHCNPFLPTTWLTRLKSSVMVNYFTWRP